LFVSSSPRGLPALSCVFSGGLVGLVTAQIPLCEKGSLYPFVLDTNVAASVTASRCSVVCPICNPRAHHWLATYAAAVLCIAPVVTWSVYQQRGVLSDDAHRELRDEVRRVLVWCGVPIYRGLHEHLHQRASLWSGEPQRSFGSLTGFSLSLLGSFCPGMALSGFKRCISCLRAASCIFSQGFVGMSAGSPSIWVELLSVTQVDAPIRESHRVTQSIGMRLTRRAIVVSQTNHFIRPQAASMLVRAGTSRNAST
jgi:hypothetical protein